MILVVIIVIIRIGIYISIRCIVVFNECEVVFVCVMKEDIVYIVGIELVGFIVVIVDDIVMGLV